MRIHGSSSVRARIGESQQRFRYAGGEFEEQDPGVAALADAVRGMRVVRIRAHTPDARIMHPIALVRGATSWAVVDARHPNDPIALSECGDINISSKTFDSSAFR